MGWIGGSPAAPAPSVHKKTVRVVWRPFDRYYATRRLWRGGVSPFLRLEAVPEDKLAQAGRAGGGEDVRAGYDAACGDVGGHIGLAVVDVVEHVLEVGSQRQASEALHGEALLHARVEDNV